MIVLGWEAEASWAGWVSVGSGGSWRGQLGASQLAEVGAPPWVPEDHPGDLEWVSEVVQCWLAGCHWVKGPVWEAGPLCWCEEARIRTKSNVSKRKMANFQHTVSITIWGKLHFFVSVWGFTSQRIFHKECIRGQGVINICSIDFHCFVDGT